MARENLTKHSIEKLKTKAYDSRVPGLGVTVQPTGKKIFFWFRRVRGKRTWKTIGEFPGTSIENARNEAQKINIACAAWKSSGYQGPSPFNRTGVVTFADAFEDYRVKHLRNHAKNPKRAEADARWQVKKYLSSIAKRRLGDITRPDVRDLHTAIGRSHGHVTANRAVTLLAAVFNWAVVEMEAFDGANPAARLKHFAETPRERYVLPQEMPVFLQTLHEETNYDLRDFVLLALFCGQRRADILSARWEDVSFNPPQWRFPSPKSSKVHLMPLRPEPLAVLQQRKRQSPDSTFVFPSRGGTGHLVELKRSWAKFLKRTGLKDLHIHDLRRTFATYISNEGVTLHIIGKTLGHASTAVTGVYSRVDQAAMNDAMTRGIRAMLTAGEKK